MTNCANMMRKARGFKMGRKVVMKMFRWAKVWAKRGKVPAAGDYKRLIKKAPDDHEYSSSSSKSKTMTKIYEWGKWVKRGAKELCDLKPLTTTTKTNYRCSGGYKRIEDGNCERRHVGVPKGHLAVYVGQKKADDVEEDEDQTHRFLVPVFYFNHPLFGKLLREAEKEYGFHQSGGITIPCPISEFQKVQAKIAGGGGRKKTTTSKHHHLL